MSDTSPPPRHPPYSTLVRAIAFLTAYLPPVVSGKAFASMSGSNAALSLALLIYLNCLSAAGEPLPALADLLRHYGAPGFRRELWNLVRSRYADLRECDLTLDVGPLRRRAVAAYPGVDVESLLALYVAAAVKAGVATSGGVRALAGRLREDGSEDVVPFTSSVTGVTPDEGVHAGERARAAGASASPVPATGECATGRGPKVPTDWRATEAIRILTEEVYDPDVMPPGSEAATAFVTMLRALRRL